MTILLSWIFLAGQASAVVMGPLPPAPKPVQTLTWEDCVALAAIKSPTLVSSNYALEASRASYLASFNGLLPTLTLSNGYASANTASKPAYTAQGVASMNIFNMGQVAAIKSASAGYSQAEANLRQTSASLRFSLRQAFAQAYFAEKNIEVAKKILEIQTKNAEEVALKYQSGKEYKGNMMDAQAKVLQSQAGLDQVLRSLRTSRRSLDQQLGLDEFSETAVTGTVVAQTPPDFPNRMEDFLAFRPDVAVQEAVVKTQRAAVNSAESPLWPSLVANYARNRGGFTEFPNTTYGWTAGATLSYPLFGGGLTSAYYNSKSAKRGLDKTEQDLRTVRDAAIVDLESTWAAYANTMDQLQFQEAALASARQRNNEAEIRYASGLLSFDNWEVIVGEWVNAEQSAIQARLSAVIAQAAWEKSLGKALGE